MKKKKKRTNPNRIPVSKADLKRASERATNDSIDHAWAIFFSVLRDKENLSNEYLRRIWNGVEELSDSVGKGYVNVADLKNTLKEEAGIRLV